MALPTAARAVNETYKFIKSLDYITRQRISLFSENSITERKISNLNSLKRQK